MLSFKKWSKRSKTVGQKKFSQKKFGLTKSWVKNFFGATKNGLKQSWMKMNF